VVGLVRVDRSIDIDPASQGLREERGGLSNEAEDDTLDLRRPAE
jgi:hypothetical protein